MRCQIWEDTFSVWNDVLRVHPCAVLALQERACEYYADGKFDAAERDLTFALEQAPFRSELYLLRGAARARTNNASAALSDLNLAVALDPHNIKTYINRGLILFNLCDLGHAMEDLSKAIELSGGRSALAFSHRSMVKNALEDTEGAAQDATFAIQMEPQMISAYVNRAVALEQLGRKNAALHDWRQALTLDPACTQAMRAVGRLTSELDR